MNVDVRGLRNGGWTVRKYHQQLHCYGVLALEESRSQGGSHTEHNPSSEQYHDGGLLEACQNSRHTCIPRVTYHRPPHL